MSLYFFSFSSGQCRCSNEPPKDSEPLTTTPNSSASEDPNNTADQSQAGGEPAAAGVAPAEEISGFGAPKPEDPSAPAEENAKGPDGKLIRPSLWHCLMMQ